MFHSKHNRALFPLVLAALTLALIGLMVYALKPEPAVQPTDTAPSHVTEDETGVTPEEYQNDLRDALSGLPQTVTETEDSLKRLVLVEDALDTVLALKVPAEYRNLHLQVASNLHLMQRGLRNETEDFADGLRMIETLIQENNWLQ